MSALATEEALRVMVVIGLFFCLGGLIAAGVWTLPSTARDIRHSSRNTPERTLFKWDLYGALLGITGLAVMLVILILLLAVPDTPTRAAVVRLGILILLSALAGVCVLAPLRRRAIEKAARRRGGAHRRRETP